MVPSVKFLAVIAVVASLFFVTSTAFSDTIPWTDNVTHWQGWGGGAGNEDGTDEIGAPKITGGEIYIDSGYLTKVTFDFASSPGWEFSKMYPGDLFLDTNSDGTWDYVVSLYNGRTNSPDNELKYQPKNSFYPDAVNSEFVYKITAGLALDGLASQTQDDNPPSFGYLVTGEDNTGYWLGYLIRNNQPFAVTGLDDSNSTQLTGSAQVHFSGASYTSPLVFDLSSADIPINGPLTIGFTTNCANDVVYASTVPEPGTPLMLGSGLILTACVLRRKKS